MMTLREALTRGWDRLDSELRLLVHPRNGKFGDFVTKRFGRGLLMALLRRDPLLAPLVSDFYKRLSDEEGARIADGVAALGASLWELVPTVTAFREAMHRADPPRDEELMYGMALGWAGSLPPTAEECDAVWRARNDPDADSAPPRHPALTALLRQQEAVSALESAIGTAWAECATDRIAAADHAVTAAESAFLDTAVNDGEQQPWKDYVAGGAWRRLLGVLAEAGLSDRETPARPAVRTAGSGRPPLDRSLQGRLTSKTFEHPEKTSEGFRSSTTRQVAHRAAETTGRPLGLATDEARTALRVGLLVVTGINPDIVAQEGVSRDQRRVRMITALARRHGYVRMSLKLGTAQAADVRGPLNEPQSYLAPRLWPRLHNSELRVGDMSAGGWWQVVYNAIDSLLRDLSGKVAASLAPAGGPVLSVARANAVAAVLAHGESDPAYWRRFADPARTPWARAQWQRMCTAHLAGPGASPAADPPAFEQAREFVRRFIDQGASS
ncbi:hypothetical protein ACEZDB_10245 [Streptacidiphilus sp. N1-3]|uniref:Uncharacterized protein n=1 Tax=Streptacidiphilus alkalitolerans TaxID=3342712 RepID=A0ABV6WYB4_9ACTN